MISCIEILSASETMEKLTEIMCNEILYILLPDYAAHEVVYLSQAIADRKSVV